MYVPSPLRLPPTAESPVEICRMSRELKSSALCFQTLTAVVSLPLLFFFMVELLIESVYSYFSGVIRGSSVQFSSVAQSCLTVCDPMNHSTPGLPVHHQLPEFTQTHVHRVSDAIQPSHPWSSPSPPAPNPSQHQSLFQ